MTYNGQNLFNAFVDTMRETSYKQFALYSDEPRTEIDIFHLSYMSYNHYHNTIVDAFFELCNEHDWSLCDALSGWQGDKHWDLHTDRWHYLCKSVDDSHWDDDGWVGFDADMLYWHKDGWYCEFCVDATAHITSFNRGRSLAEELELAKKRGKCYRTLPKPVMFADEWAHRY